MAGSSVMTMIEVEGPGGPGGDAAGGDMPFAVDAVSDAEVRRLVGSAAYQRGRAYADAGRVVSLEVDGHTGDVSALVHGSRGQTYHTMITVDCDDADTVRVDSYCSCPVGYGCKHAAAVLLARQRPSPPDPDSGPELPVVGWERALARVVEPVQHPTTGAPLALQLQMVDAYRGFRGDAFATDVPDRRLSLRPLMQGRSGRWVKTGVSWQKLRHQLPYPDYRTEHCAALRGVLSADQSALAYAGYRYDEAVYLDTFGPGVWTALRQAVDLGVTLLDGNREPQHVVAASPALVSLDVRRGDGGDAQVWPRVTVDGQAVDPATVSYVGTPAHGLVAESATGLLLAPLQQVLRSGVAELVQQPVRIPAADVERFVGTYYPRLQRTIAVTSSDASVQLPEVAPPRLALTVLYVEQHKVEVEWEVEYRVGESVRRYPLSDSGSDEGRDNAAERGLLWRLSLPDDELPQLRSRTSGYPELATPVVLSGMDAVRFVDDVLPRMYAAADVVVEEVGDRPDFRPARSAPEVHVSARDSADDPDWFDLGVGVWVDGEEVPFGELFMALNAGETHLLLDSGVWVCIDLPELHRLRQLIEEARALQESDRAGMHLSVYQAGLWEELCSLGVVDEQSRRWAGVVDALLSTDSVDPPELPQGVDAVMRPYQVEGYRWLTLLRGYGLGGILADDMGLGKTLQTLAMVCRAKEAGELSAPMLVVAPASVVSGWAAEAARFAPDLRVVTIAGTQRKRGADLPATVAGADVVITSYTLFRLEYSAYDALPWTGLVLDEAQFVKNHQAKTYHCVRRLGAPFKVAITGTPLENNLMDLWALLSIVAPGLFPNPERFSEYYRRPIEKGTDPELLSTLRRRVRPLMLRRTKEQVAAELPAKQEQIIDVPLTPKHRTIYDTHLQRERQKILGLVEDMSTNRFTILRSLTRLRQFALDPSLVDEEYAGVRSAKLDVLQEHLAELVAGGHRALVFSQFTSYLTHVRHRLDTAGIGYAYLDGSTRDRAAVIAEFKQGDAPVFVISLKAGGFGLNLTEADYCFVLDPWWNPATEQQAIDRTHRIGQDKSVVVYRLVSSATIEEKVMTLKERKAELFRNVMDADQMMSAPLTAADIKGLLEAEG